MAIKTCTGTTSQPYVHVQARLSQPCTITATGLDAPLVTDATGVVGGTYSISLWAASDLTPTGTYYTVTEFLGSTDNTFNVQVPNSAGPFTMSSILVGTPTASPSPNHVSTLIVDGTSGVAINAAGDVAARSFTASSTSPYTPSAAAGSVEALLLNQWGNGIWSIKSTQNPSGAAKGDAQEVGDAVMAAGSAVLTSASGKFLAGDVGKVAVVRFVGAAAIANPTVAIAGADGGAGATTLPTGAYTFAYAWAIRGYSSLTAAGTSAGNYTQTVANHIITLTVPSLPAGAEVTEVYCTAAPGGAFTGFLGLTNTTTFSYVTGLTINGRSPVSTTLAGATLQTTIASYQSATQVTLAATATLASAASGTNLLWGTDDSASRNAAIATAVAAPGGGEVYYPPTSGSGVGYLIKTGATINVPLVGQRGVFSLLYYTGAADCQRTQLSPFLTNGQTGNMASLTIDGTYALDGASGIHLGDANQATLEDVCCRHFNGVGSKNFWFDNRTNWTERLVLDRVWQYDGTIGMLFDVNGGNISFGHTFMFNHKVSLNVSQVGLQLQNGAALVNSLIHATGNANLLSTTVKVLDTASLGFSTAGNVYSITVEGAAGAVGLNLAAGSALFGSGVIALSMGGYTNINAGAGNIQFIGQFNCPGIYAMAGEGGDAMGGLAIPTGDLTMPIGGGKFNFLGTPARIVAGTQGLSIRDSTNAFDNAATTDAGGFNIRGVLQLLAANSQVQPGATAFNIVNHGFTATNLTLTDAGLLKLIAQIYPGTPALAQQTACGLLAGTGVPSNANGNNGDVYFRSDGGAGTTIYQKRAGSWVATAA